MEKPLPCDETSMANAAPAAPFMQLVSDHELICLIGKGSAGEVWLARSVLGSYRAIKIVRSSAFKHRRPFDREFNGIQKFEPVSRLHDGLVDILQVGLNETEGCFYYVMELADDTVSGQLINPQEYTPRTLAQDLMERERLPVAECIRLGAALASALGFLHRRGLIHRDIKPSNIIFVNGFPKLADIGLVTAFAEDKAYVGTEGFIPPEGPGTVRADIYSFGKVLYEISTGLDRLQYPALPEDLGKSADDRDLIQFNKIILRACRANPSDRFKSAEQMMAALLAFQFGVRKSHILRAQHRWVKVLGVIGALTAAAVVGGMLWRLIHLLKLGQ
jgi:serine/threonine protein kinase